MKIDMTTQLMRTTSHNKSLEFFAGIDDWSKALTEGQIIKGRVLRQHSNDKYSIMFGKKERIVDSTISFQIGEEIKGRISNIENGRVTIKLSNKLMSPNNQVENEPVAENLSTLLGDEENNLNDSIVNQSLFDNIRPSGSPGRIDTTILMKIATYYFSKVGLPKDSFLLNYFANNLLAAPDLQKKEFNTNLPNLVFTAHNADEFMGTKEITAMLAEFYREIFEQPSNFLMRYGNDWKELASQYTSDIGLKNKNTADLEEGDKKDFFSSFNSYLLNIQLGGAAQHRLHNISIIIDGETREFDVAFFDSKSEGDEGQQPQGKTLQFVLDTKFGKVSINVKTINNHISFSMTSMNESLIENLENFHSVLENEAREIGWVIDSSNYNLSADVLNPKMEITKRIVESKQLDFYV